MHGVVTFSASQKAEEEVIWFKTGYRSPLSTKINNKWAYGIFEEWQRHGLIKVHIVEVIGLLKNYDYHHVESLETPLV